ncbi:hypothetical protein ND860_10180 [Leptospira levettii]|uniref:hypothetical protein n=1 Tax=Leptospira levettii TaxID=2023178 RepID=UPI0013FDC21D|nr:hypothetical protein [Leptospira levettii]MCW7471891.1 hypothetical protein [Leptospira levettii]MCW7496895.1 hypothetical protein [Leptospira levettii]
MNPSQIQLRLNENQMFEDWYSSRGWKGNMKINFGCKKKTTNIDECTFGGRLFVREF